jgi:hypothetical protein
MTSPTPITDNPIGGEPGHVEVIEQTRRQIQEVLLREKRTRWSGLTCTCDCGAVFQVLHAGPTQAERRINVVVSCPDCKAAMAVALPAATVVWRVALDE